MPLVHVHDDYNNVREGDEKLITECARRLLGGRAEAYELHLDEPSVELKAWITRDGQQIWIASDHWIDRAKKICEKMEAELPAKLS